MLSPWAAFGIPLPNRGEDPLEQVITLSNKIRRVFDCKRWKQELDTLCNPQSISEIQAKVISTENSIIVKPTTLSKIREKSILQPEKFDQQISVLCSRIYRKKEQNESVFNSLSTPIAMKIHSQLVSLEDLSNVGRALVPDPDYHRSGNLWIPTGADGPKGTITKLRLHLQRLINVWNEKKAWLLKSDKEKALKIAQSSAPLTMLYGIEGPHGCGKCTMLRSLAQEFQLKCEFLSGYQEQDLPTHIRTLLTNSKSQEHGRCLILKDFEFGFHSGEIGSITKTKNVSNFSSFIQFLETLSIPSKGNQTLWPVNVLFLVTDNLFQGRNLGNNPKFCIERFRAGTNRGVILKFFSPFVSKISSCMVKWKEKAMTTLQSWKRIFFGEGKQLHGFSPIFRKKLEVIFQEAHKFLNLLFDQQSPDLQELIHSTDVRKILNFLRFHIETSPIFQDLRGILVSFQKVSLDQLPLIVNKWLIQRPKLLLSNKIQRSPKELKGLNPWQLSSYLLFSSKSFVQTLISEESVRVIHDLETPRKALEIVQASYLTWPYEEWKPTAFSRDRRSGIEVMDSISEMANLVSESDLHSRSQGGLSFAEQMEFYQDNKLSPELLALGSISQVVKNLKETANSDRNCKLKEFLYVDFRNRFEWKMPEKLWDKLNQQEENFHKYKNLLLEHAFTSRSYFLELRGLLPWMFYTSKVSKNVSPQVFDILWTSLVNENQTDSANELDNLQLILKSLYSFLTENPETGTCMISLVNSGKQIFIDNKIAINTKFIAEYCPKTVSRYVSEKSEQPLCDEKSKKRKASSVDLGKMPQIQIDRVETLRMRMDRVKEAMTKKLKRNQVAPPQRTATVQVQVVDAKKAAVLFAALAKCAQEMKFSNAHLPKTI
jgi:hypothetical protein